MSDESGRRRAVTLVLVLLAAAGLPLLWASPIPQDPAYHAFADQRAWGGVANAQNVLSNLPFLLVGGLGLASLRHGAARQSLVDPRERAPYTVFFAGVALTAVGSAYYHLAPDNARLVWDRLPMTLAFMGLFAALLGERLGAAAGRRLLAPLLAIGLASVVVWDLTERRGHGDLRLYALVQFFPLLAVPVLACCTPSRYTRGGDLGLALALYLVAKVFELFDRSIFALGHVVGGHALKHLAAAGSTYVVLRMLERRTLSSPAPGAPPAAPRAAP
jgi:hypothetical protein